MLKKLQKNYFLKINELINFILLRWLEWLLKSSWMWSCSMEGLCYRFQGSCTGMPPKEERVCQMSWEPGCCARKSKQDTHWRTQGLKRLVLSQKRIRKNFWSHIRARALYGLLNAPKQKHFSLCLVTARKCRKQATEALFM